MKVRHILTGFFLLMATMAFAQPRYGIQEIPVCWSYDGTDSSLNQVTLVSSRAVPLKILFYRDADGNTVDISAGGDLAFGHCGSGSTYLPDSILYRSELLDSLNSISVSTSFQVGTVSKSSDGTDYTSSEVSDSLDKYNFLYWSQEIQSGASSNALVILPTPNAARAGRTIVFNMVDNDTGDDRVNQLSGTLWYQNTTFATYTFDDEETRTVRCAQIPDGSYAWIIDKEPRNPGVVTSGSAPDTTQTWVDTDSTVKIRNQGEWMVVAPDRQFSTISDLLNNNKSIPLRNGEIVEVAETGARYKVQADSVDGYTVDGVGVISVDGKYAQLQPNKNGLYDLKVFAIGNGVDNDADAIESALNLSKVSGNGIFIPKGTYLASGLSYNWQGGELRLVGENPDSCKIKGAGLITIDTANVYLEKVQFTDSPNNYSFRYNDASLPITGDTLNRTVTIKECKFVNVERAFSLFENTDNYLNPFSVNVIDNEIDSVGVGGFMFRGYLINSHFVNNRFNGIQDRSTYSFCINVGDTDNRISRNINISGNKFNNILGEESSSSEITYIIISYGQSNVMYGNQFYNCRRGLYSRGDDGLIYGNTFLNPDSTGRLPFIFKGGNTYTLTDNVVIGKQNGIVLFDNDPDVFHMAGNTIDVTLDLVSGFTTNHLMSAVGDWSLVSIKSNYINISSRVGNTTALFSLSNKGDIDLVDNVIIDDGYILSANNSDTHHHNIRGNSIYSSTFYFGKPKNLDMVGNNFYLSTSNANFIRLNGGGRLNISSNNFLRNPTSNFSASRFTSGFIDLNSDFERLFIKDNWIDTSGATVDFVFDVDGSGDVICENNTFPIKYPFRISSYSGGESTYKFYQNKIYDPNASSNVFLLRTDVDLDSLIIIESKLNEIFQNDDTLNIVGLLGSVSDYSTFKVIRSHEDFGLKLNPSYEVGSFSTYMRTKIDSLITKNRTYTYQYTSDGTDWTIDTFTTWLSSYDELRLGMNITDAATSNFLASLPTPSASYNTKSIYISATDDNTGDAEEVQLSGSLQDSTGLISSYYMSDFETVHLRCMQNSNGDYRWILINKS